MRRNAWLLFVVFASTAPAALAGNWPGWRGPTGDGLSKEMNVPLTIPAAEKLRWKVAIPGRGHSSPIVWEDSVFVTTALEEEKPSKRVLLRIDRATGSIVWQRVVLETGLERLHNLNSRASSTPATDGKRIFVSFLDGKQMFVAAYDFNGVKLWERRPGPFASVHGFCTNPVLYKDRLIVNGDHDGDAYIAILRQEDGGTVLKIARENRTRSYSTPIIANVGGRDQLMLTGSKCTAGYDVETGERQWICDGPSEQMVATLLRGRGLIFSLGGFPERHLLAIKEGGRGDLTNSQVVWRSHKSVPYVPSALLYGDLLHVVSDEGFYTCYDAASGRLHTQERISKHISASLVGAEDRVYILDDYGTLTVIENKPGMHKLAVSKLGEDVFASPAVAHHSLFLRGVEHLFCVGGDK